MVGCWMRMDGWLLDEDGWLLDERMFKRFFWFLRISRILTSGDNDFF